MSNKIQELGNDPVNPTFFKDGELNSWGLTKREYFAGLAIQGIMSNPDYSISINQGKTIASVIANDAIKVADALLKALENEK